MGDDSAAPRTLSIANESQLCPHCGTSLWILNRTPEESETAPRTLFCGVCNQTFIAFELKDDSPH
jgi:hypothetical protein